jgi:hypothetical protein
LVTLEQLSYWISIKHSLTKPGLFFCLIFKVALRHAAWHNRAPANESILVNKKGKWKEDLHIVSFPLFLLFSFSFLSPFFFSFFLFPACSFLAPQLLSFWGSRRGRSPHRPCGSATVNWALVSRNDSHVG